jgi:hypothetical protein
MPDAKFKTLAAALGSLAAVLSGTITDAANAASGFAALKANAQHHSHIIKVGDLGWRGPGWGPAAYPAGCAGAPCGAAGWQTSGWGPAPYPAGCGVSPCGAVAGWRTSGWGPPPCSPCGGAAGWHTSSWGPAPYPVGCGGPCGAPAGWHTSGWGPAPYPVGCGTAPCAAPGWRYSGWDSGWQTTSWSWDGPAW